MQPEIVAQVQQLTSGALLIRPLHGRAVKLTHFAEVKRQADGAFLIEAVPDQIEMADAVKILGTPYTTLRRIVERGLVKAWKSSPGRWALCLASVQKFKARIESDPEFWESVNRV